MKVAPCHLSKTSRICSLFRIIQKSLVDYKSQSPLWNWYLVPTLFSFDFVLIMFSCMYCAATGITEDIWSTVSRCIYRPLQVFKVERILQSCCLLYVVFSFQDEMIFFTVSRWFREYSLCSELLVVGMDVSRCILVLDTSIFATSNLERREYMFYAGRIYSHSQFPLGMYIFHSKLIWQTTD